jgi:hypothetical protein
MVMRHGAGRPPAVASLARLATAALAALCAALAPAMADADRRLEVGQAVSDQVAVGGKQVPLPSGEWRVAAAGAQAFGPASVGAFGAIQNVILFRRQGRRVVAVAEINTNTVPVDDGWGAAASCERSTQFLLLTRYRSGWDLSCMLVQPTYAPTGGPGPAAWRGALREAAVTGLVVPDLWLTAAFRVSDRQDVVDVRYHFAPGLLIDRLRDGADGRQDWSPARVSASADRLAAVRLLSSWAVGADEWIERGLRNQLAGRTLDMPRRAAFFSNTPQVDAKLHDLERLYRSGTLSADRYLAQQQEALTEVPVLAEGADVIGGSVQKSLSLRAVNSLVGYALGLAITVGAPVTGWVAAPAALAYSTVFVLNDRLWEARWTGDRPVDNAATADFLHLGVPA